MRRNTLADLLSPVTGSVFEISCSVGDQVRSGDELMVIESMKMEVPVEAPSDGTIGEILVEKGQPVSEGDRLIVLN